MNELLKNITRDFPPADASVRRLHQNARLVDQVGGNPLDLVEVRRSRVA